MDLEDGRGKFELRTLVLTLILLSFFFLLLSLVDPY